MGIPDAMQDWKHKHDELLESCGFVPPGHYYSPVPALADIRRDEARIFGPWPRTIAGIDMREAEQLELLESFVPFYKTMPFQHEPSAGLRYHFNNPSYAYSDAVMLHCMLRKLHPQRLIEIGSGFSSCVSLDTNERFFEGRMQTTFIEPYPDLLRSLIRPEDRQRTTIIEKRLQDVELSLFDTLQAGDVLFVDSTHVSKIDSDVNRIFFEILPRLARGVHVHFHDIFYPFEYPKEWIYSGRAWTEMYMLRTFLQFNSAYRIVLMNTFMEGFHEAFFAEKMPLCLVNRGGSIWLERAG